MPRMVDLLLSQQQIPVPQWHTHGMELKGTEREYMDGLEKHFSELNKIHLDIIPKLPVFEVTNCHHYSLQRQSKIYEDWPCLMLPMDFMWMEYKRGDRRTPTHVGALLSRNDKALEVANKWEFPETPEQAKYAITVTTYFAQGGQVVGPVAFWDVALNEKGAPVEFAYKHMAGDGVQQNEAMLVKLAGFFQALAFMHCKNMRVEKEEPEVKLSKKWRKKTGKPLMRWNTLVIEPMRDTLARESGKSVVTKGIKPSIHIARGHFAEYGEEFGKGKLFGKYEGRFWVPSHVRGSKEEGIVLHDYEVKP